MFYVPLFFPPLPPDYDIPPTIYAILNSLVNFNVEEKTKIKDLPKMGHSLIFDFDYPLSTQVNKDNFEILILKHFLMRRIGYETMTAFKIALDVKLNEIMPYYNKIFDSYESWNLFNDGESITREQTQNGTNNQNGTQNSSSNGSDTSDRRYSKTPQNNLAQVQNGQYVTDYNYDTNTTNITANATTKNDTTTTNNLTEEINRTPHEKIDIYNKFLENRNKIMTLIFNDLDELFYGLV